MPGQKRTETQIHGDALATAIAVTLGREARATRRRHRRTQRQLADSTGISRSRYADIERGLGASAPLGTWVRIGAALGRPLAVQLSRDLTLREPSDAGHLAAQELVLRLARGHGRTASFELATRPADPARAADVGLRDDVQRVLIVVEILNRVDDLGAAARATDRKVAEAARGPALFAGADDEPYRVASCWLLVDTAANRRLVARYPEVIRARFPGSSVAWVRALRDGSPPPSEPGVAWIDPRAGRLTALRLKPRTENEGRSSRS